MARLAQQVGFSERHFITRENGSKAYPAIQDQLLGTAEYEPTILTFPPDQLVDVSFADETIIRLGMELLEGQYGERGILLEGLSDDSVENIEAAIRYQGFKVAFLGVVPDGAWKVIGPLEKSLVETLYIAAEERQLTAPKLADRLQVAINTASNRLKRLFDLHLIWREHSISERGLVYIYHFWDWVV